ncbi:multisubunit potassium/proton antiporter, PhaF subunit [Pseudomonas peli]|jgi:multicomponent K+:H+ antiporter subunit F|uniref:Multisubunit potassium/proton antiporter, PhaF subunit n=1 Tax=Pseudomonas peli TaxID=592361 RepID=A0AB37Z8Y6_9PSED|nr:MULTISPECIES: K+/H+ antiporter subunit F [Pseudomonas]OHC29029.1 MAG: K+/H+ antiporter subunit F [Pseudomonadales bacterium RIFCSPHIGHO2_02_FULL_60_43]MDR7024856.1 multicomponent K+:H+ antiporter subunit F [Pseudomonas peli]NMY49380.1 K+/H+ antiporter subunit F [Pseudomonas sp. WS 5011]NMZ69992.1 K+/H+ antiporter subunit F [Pseudomonas peli]SCW64392.1 multisubunit potassium/proton antiporter, PhaF subunit [Pseudomonas peli]|tara:strand:- start:10772 stop:11041 length:270 start_codon:yes stop_codon:yes gene_type:complete
MLAYVIPLCLMIIGVALVLTMARLIIGPDLPDRILALDTLYINAIAMLVLLGIWLGSDLYFEAALLIAVMGFIGTVAVAKYLLRGDIIE